MSSNLNSLGASLFEDFIRPCIGNKIADRTANRIVQSIVVIVGCICIAIVFIVDKLGAILQVSKFLKQENTTKLLALVSMVMKLQFIYRAGNFLTSRESQERLFREGK
jgi:nitrate/nitrite transporter NarK